MEARETIIVGGGIAGLACARQLCDAGRAFTLVSEDVGGRIRLSRDGTLNFGAYYVMADYHHVLQYVRCGRELSMLRSRVHLGNRSYSAWSWRSLATLLQSARFRRLLREFRDHYEAFKKRCETTSQARALRSDPFLWDLYRRSAPDLIAEHRVREFADAFVAPGLHGSTFLPLHRLTGFVFLQFTLPLIVPIYEFSFRKDAMIRGFEDSIQSGSVTRIEREQEGHRVELASRGVLHAQNLVVATPIDVSRKLLGLGPVKPPVRAHMFHVSGSLRSRWAREPVHLFAQEDATLAISRQPNGSVLFCSSQEKPDFDHFFTNHRVLEHHYWNPAFNIEGDTLLECDQGENLYLIGDCNVCGLEDSFITGLYAANRILGRGEDTDDRRAAGTLEQGAQGA